MGDAPPRHKSRYSSSPSPREREKPEPSRSRTPPRRGRSGPINDGPDRSRSRTPPRRSRREPDINNPGNNLYVTGLSTRVNEKDLQEHFSREGKVLECRLVLDPRTRESRGFGFVTMEHLEDAERCIKYLNRSTLEGRMITVEKNHGPTLLPQLPFHLVSSTAALKIASTNPLLDPCDRLVLCS
uniref:RRM domain-containing protein n=1 Tax=Physcomitrium patens TaxID=3218 RepID=A0A7I4BS85_PHYPA